MYQGDVVLRRELKDLDDETLDSFLLEFFQKIYDQTGYPRPASLYDFRELSRTGTDDPSLLTSRQ
jgi:hypothetical protein